MKRSEWSDKQLVELLRQMPKIQDHRKPRDIYQILSLKKRKYPIWVIPGIAAAAAMLIVIILVPKLINGTQISYDQAKDNKITTEKMADLSGSSQESSVMKKQNNFSENEEASKGAQPKLLTTEGLKTAVYEDEVGNGKVLTYWIPDEQAQLLIPVSTIVDEDKQKSWITLFNEKMALLKEKDWGLTDYYPVNATIKMDTDPNTVAVDVPVNHQYGQGSNNETMFLNVLKKDISTNSKIRKINFYTNGQRGIVLGNFGKKNTLDIDEDVNHGYFFYYPKNSGTPFLVPSLIKYQDIKTALAAMEHDEPETELKASLPNKYFEGLSIKGTTLFVTLNSDLAFNSNYDALHSFEALLLAAKDFGMQKVFIENPPGKNLGPFDLTKEVSVPIAPNLRSLQ